MSGVGSIKREQRRRSARKLDHHTKQGSADVMRQAAMSMLAAPYCNDEMSHHANAMLEMVGDMLDLPRSGWYPRRPLTWRP